MATIEEFKSIGIELEDPRPGQNLTTCPRCSHDRKKSDAKCLSVNLEEGVYKCFAGDTEVITWSGIKKIKDLAGSTHRVITKGGEWVDVAFRSYGQRKFLHINLSRNGIKKAIVATDDHEWFVHGVTKARKTSDLLPGNKLISEFPEKVAWSVDEEAQRRGFIFGDGTTNRWGRNSESIAYLCGSEKKRDMRELFADSLRYSYEKRDVCGPFPEEYKSKIPDNDVGVDYLVSWLSGYFAADGHASTLGHTEIYCKNQKTLARVEEICAIAGIRTSSVSTYNRRGIGDKWSLLSRIRFFSSSLDEKFFIRERHKKNYKKFVTDGGKELERARWQVVSVVDCGDFGESFCCEVPVTHSFVLRGNILTSNCHHCDWSGKVHDPAVEAEREKMFKWFEARSISRQTVLNANISIENGWIKFPYTQYWREINAKYRHIDEKKFRQTKDGVKSLYGIDEVRNDIPYLAVVEGELDCLAMRECGFTNVVSVPDGAPNPGSAEGAKLQVFDDPKIEAFLAKIPTFIIAVDEDPPGQALRDALIRRLGFEKCKVVSWVDLEERESAKDANEFLMLYGPSKVQDRVSRAKFVPVEGIYTVKDVMEDMYREYEVGVEKGISTGIIALDSLWKIRTREMSIVYGSPGSGKSSLMSRVAIGMADMHEWKFCFFPAENLPVSRFYNYLVELYLEKPIVDHEGNKMPQKDYFRGMEWVHKHFTCILPEENPSLDSILSRAEVQVRRWGANAIVIDPWTELYAATAKNENKADYIERALSKTVRFSKNHNVHIFVVAHPAKPKEGSFAGRAPEPYEIAGSAMFYNKADCIVCVNRPDRTKTDVDILVKKVRFRECGECGKAEMKFNKWTGVYTPRY